MTTHNKDKIIAAAKECGIGWAEGLGGMPEFLEAFYAITFEDGRHAEREECAKVCMQQCSVIEEPHEFERCAEAIRARGDTK